MDARTIIRKMHDDSNVSYYTASKRMGRPSQYISSLLAGDDCFRIDTFAAVAEAFGYHLLVTGGESAISIKSDDKASHCNGVAAADVITWVINTSPLSSFTIAARMGKPTSFITDITNREYIPCIATLVDIAEACGDEVIMSGHGNTYYLSKRLSSDSFNEDTGGNSVWTQQKKAVAQLIPSALQMGLSRNHSRPSYRM